MNAQGMAYGGPIPKVYNPLTGEYEDPDMGAIADLLGVASTPQQRGFQGEVRAIDNALMPQAASPTLANLAPSSYGQQVDSAPEIGLNTYQSPAGKMTKVIQGLPQQQQSGGDIDSQINALMSQVTAMMKPGYREKHPDAAYSSREYRGGVPDIQNRPEYQNLVQLLQLKKAQTGAMGTPEKEPDAVRTQKWAIGMHETMPEGPMKQAFGEKYGLAGKVAEGEKPMTEGQRLKMEKDLAKDFASVQQTDETMKNIVGSISDIRGSKGLDWREGYSGYMPAWSQGKEAMTAQNRIDTLKGKVTQMGKAMASLAGAIGPMAVQEWKIVSDAVNAIDPTSGNFDEQLSNIEAQAVSAMNRQRERYTRQYGGKIEDRYPQFSLDGGAPPPPPPATGGQASLSPAEQKRLAELKAKYGR